MTDQPKKMIEIIDIHTHEPRLVDIDSPGTSPGIDLDDSKEQSDCECTCQDQEENSGS